MKQAIYFIGGVTNLALALVGVALPILPTTPFALAAVFFFARSSPRFENYVRTHPVVGPYISNYEKGEMTLSAKKKTLGSLWVTMVISMIITGVVVGIWWVPIVLFVVASFVSLHIWRMREP
ncbi:YbaN family protein [uncultured Corynebacterium sp.]|uniref:YbaN family protein n=1 Tax=uncultured Corynebacterium sp. TaxID=159447 RepID=UPI00263A2C68|nr:YbaN family protein [uncultured Corynebacterium sp.]